MSENRLGWGQFFKKIRCNPGIAHVIEVKILSVNSELGNGTIEVEVMIDSQPIQDYLTQAEVDQCQSHVDPIEDPDLDPSEEPKALSNIDASMSNIQPNDTTISDPMFIWKRLNIDWFYLDVLDGNFQTRRKKSCKSTTEASKRF